MGADKKTFGEQKYINTPGEDPEIIQKYYQYDYGAYALGLASVAHGVYEYSKTANGPILGMGLLLGAVMGYGGYQVYRKSDTYSLPMAGSLALTAYHGKKYYDTKRLMPYAAIAALGAVVFVRLGARVVGVMDTKKKKIDPKI